MSTETPTAGRRFGATSLVLMLLVGIGAGGAAVWVATSGLSNQHDAVAATKYYCPMHPTIVRDHPDNCPLCGMKLVLADGGGAASPPEARKVRFYRSPMNPNETSPVPRKDEMGMDYLPVYEEEMQGEAPVDGLATVSIDAQRQQLIGLKTAEVTEGPVGGSWRTVGRVVIAETHVRHVNVKVAGFVERIYVDFVGKPVRKGDPLFSMYSPDLVSAQNEYLLAQKTHAALSQAGGTSAAGAELVQSSRRRLKLWDVTDAAIAQLERTGTPTKTLTLYSPLNGVVTQKDVVEGASLSPGDMPYEIVDLSTVWALADVYETELARVRVGMPAKLELKAMPGRAFAGKVIFVDPMLDGQSRTAKVRLEFQNPTGELKPEMFGEVVLETTPRQALRVPADAVIPTGTKSVVFVSLPDGKFQPRVVQLGATDGDIVEVSAGLAAGERVVTRANFLVDSESRLRASLAAMGGAEP